MATVAIRNIIRDQRIHEIHGYMETGMREQMHTFQQSIQALVNANLVSASCLTDSSSDNPAHELSVENSWKMKMSK